MVAKSKSREDAIAKGEIFYFSDKPCPQGHVGPRYVSCFRCLECAQIDAENVKRKNAERKASRPEAELSPREIAKRAGKPRYKTSKPCRHGHFAERLTINGACVECARQRQSNRTNTPEFKKKRREYLQQNADRYRAHTRNRRAKRNGAGEIHSFTDIEELWKRQSGKCAYCGKRLRKNGRSGCHVDHIIALSKGGMNSRDNLQLTCGACNLRKHNKDPITFARELGKLL